MTAADRVRAARGVQHRWRTDRRTFERLVQEALNALPAPFRERLSNVALVVEEWSSPEEQAIGAATGEDQDDELLGLYQGIPLGDRAAGYHLTLPDRITIYRQPILQSCRNEAEVREEIRQTVLHEVGHYFGLSDDELP